MPTGVIVTTSVAPGANASFGNVDGTFFVTGLFERGDTTQAVECRSFQQFRQLFGERPSYGFAWDHVQTYFAEAQAAGRVFVARAVGASASKGTLSLNDRAATPVPTLRIDAANEGDWSRLVSVEVADGDIANTFTLTVKYLDDVETYFNLASPAAAVTALQTSLYVRGTDLGSPTAAPSNNPAVSAAAFLSSGADDRGSVDTAKLVATMNAMFPKDLGPGIVAIPGQPHTIATDLAAHCAATSRVGAISPTLATTVTGAISAARSLRSIGSSETLGLFYPGVLVSDGAGGTRTIGPEGFVAGVRARTAASNGVWQAPIGEFGVAKSIVGVEKVLTVDDINSLYDAAVNAIKVEVTPRLYGWRSLSGDLTNWKFLSWRDTVNVVAYRLAQAVGRFHGRDIDGSGHLLAEIENDLKAVLDPIAAVGGLFARQEDTTPGSTPVLIDPGYTVDTSTAVNPASQLADGHVVAAVGIRPSPIADLFEIRLVKAAPAIAF